MFCFTVVFNQFFSSGVMTTTEQGASDAADEHI
jgi:hypothetical protein